MPTTERVHQVPRSDEYLWVTQHNFKPFYFTFGYGQAFPNSVVCIWADAEDLAREKMHELFGPKWSMCYTKERIEKYEMDYGPLMLVGEYVA